MDRESKSIGESSTRRRSDRQKLIMGVSRAVAFDMVVTPDKKKMILNSKDLDRGKRAPYLQGDSLGVLVSRRRGGDRI
jgi:hypothetical protein